MPDGDRRLIFVLLLDDDAHLKNSEREWLHGIENVSLMCHPHVVAYGWKRADWPEVQQVLL
jgi:hypothetical protein